MDILVKIVRFYFTVQMLNIINVQLLNNMNDDLSGLKDTKDYKFWINNSSFKTLKKALLKKKYISEINIKNIQKKKKEYGELKKELNNIKNKGQYNESQILIS